MIVEFANSLGRKAREGVLSIEILFTGSLRQDLIDWLFLIRGYQFELIRASPELAAKVMKIT